MEDYTTSQNKVKNIDQNNLGELSSSIIPASPDSSDNVKAIIDTILRMIPGAEVLSVKNINGLAPDVKSHCVISCQRKQKDVFNRKQLVLNFNINRVISKERSD
ncbi:hypothetical protein ER57_02015 [Smithella sp. SCADC]|jgi:hypothetical protein|nr:hypothetical protein ER57_02015 [Smithella sp. SCADC]HAR49046.1 hypothetical protein [Smithella sp.]